MYSNTVKLVGAMMRTPSHPPSLPYTLTSYWINEQTKSDVHVSNLNWQHFFPCHVIHLYHICTRHELRFSFNQRVMFWPTRNRRDFFKDITPTGWLYLNQTMDEIHLMNCKKLFCKGPVSKIFLTQTELNLLS